MADAVDYYAILGIAPHSDEVVIRAAYRALMLKFHPDTNGDVRSTLRAAQINEAHNVLSDASKRARYDEQTSRARGPASGTPPPDRTPGKSTLQVTGWGWVFLGVVAFSIIASLSEKKGSVPAAPNKTSRSASSAAVTPSIETVGRPKASLMTSANETASEVSPELQSPKAIAFEDMESAALNFDHVLQRRGIVGAKAFSKGCHRLFARQPNWTIADRCAAFDFAAAHIDSGINTASQGTVRQNDYFIFEDENQVDNYALFKATPEHLNDRLARIRRAATLTVDRVINDRLDRQRRRREREAALNTVAAQPAP